MSHVFLTGFMGAGKSTVGRLLAEMMHLPFVDLDAVVEDREGRPIQDIFEQQGEERFRCAESDALSTLASAASAVVALGGGTVLAQENRELMAREGTVVYLAVSKEQALARVGKGSGRPLLMGETARLARTLLDARQGLYESVADIVIDTSERTAERVAEEVLDALRARESEGESTRRIQVRAASARYDVVVGRGLLGRTGTLLRLVANGSRAAIVSDETVWQLFGETLRDSLGSAGLEVSVVTVPAGEGSKSWERAGEVIDRLARAGLDRTDTVVALGGGVVGDLAGFCAAVYLRGIAWASVPTTLLAQVDSSIGGKTGVDLRSGKNLAGAVHQPVLVVTDPGVLHSLPDLEWRSGLAEVAKTAILAGEEELRWLERSADGLLRREPNAVAHAVGMCASFKARVVSGDELERGPRESLNLGHTLGHAVEKVAGYGKVPHGVAVAEGIRFAARLAETEGAPAAWTRRQGRLLDVLGLEASRERYDAGALREAIRSDKKSRAGDARFVLALAPGVWECRAIGEGQLRLGLAEWAGHDRQGTRG